MILPPQKLEKSTTCSCRIVAKSTRLIVGVGGFLGAGEKDVAVPFSAVKQTTKNNKTYLTMDTTKDALKSAPGFKYDRDTTAWVPDQSEVSVEVRRW